MLNWLPASGPARSMLRFALGTTLAMAFATGSSMPVGYIIPILTVNLLANTPACPSLAGGSKIILLITGSVIFGLLFSAATLRYPMVSMLMITLLLFYIFRAAAKGTPVIVCTMLLITITMIPVVALNHQGLALGIAGGLVSAGFFAMLFVWLSYALLPDNENGLTSPPDKPSSANIDDRTANHTGLISTLVVMPAVALFFYFGLVQHLITLVFICMLALTPDLQKSRKGALALLMANIGGGIVAVILFQILVATPEYFVMLLWIFATGLLFAQRIYSERPTATLYVTAYATVLLLIASTTGSFGGDADAKFYTRIIGIGLAAIYIIVAFVIVEAYSRSRLVEKRI